MNRFPCLATRVVSTQSNVSIPLSTHSKMSSIQPIPNRWRGRESRRGTVQSRILYNLFFAFPNEPPMAIPSNGRELMYLVAFILRSLCSPPWIIPYRACFLSLYLSDRRSHLCVFSNDFFV